MMNKLFSILGLQFELHTPLFLWLFFLFIPLIFIDLKRKKTKATKVPTTQGMSGAGEVKFVFTFLKITKYIILSAMIIALARPRSFSIVENDNEGKGIDIMLSVDISYSMLARDLTPDRLDALKKIATQFIDDRPVDKIGVVAYAGEAFLKVPLTTDHNIVKQQINQLDPNQLVGGTAIGEGLAVAVNHIKGSQGKSKVIILMTDGVQTIQNSLAPITAAKLAADNGIKVYTIGIGSNSYAPTPTQMDPFGNLFYTDQKVEIDEPTLREVARVTDGLYFRATSNQSLQDIYNEINQLEKSDIKAPATYHYREYFRYFLWVALGFLLLDALLRWVIYKTLM